METRDRVEKGLQVRELPMELRAERQDSGAMVAAGLAIPYGVETVLWADGDYEEREVIEKGAFSQSLTEIDQRALWNHRRETVLGRRSAGTLELAETDGGVKFVLVFPDSPEGQSKFVSVDRGDVNAMSFSWYDREIREEVLTLEGTRIYKRTVIRGDLMEISPVTWEAYKGATTIEARQEQHIARTKDLIDTKLSEASDGFDAAAAADRSATLREMEIELTGGHINAST
jgi:HK97 family phage prohead protease